VIFGTFFRFGQNIPGHAAFRLAISGSVFGRKLCEFLQSLLSKAVYFPVTQASLNSASLMPQTDSYGLRLVGGPVQVRRRQGGQSPILKGLFTQSCR
jgi:hypothetical protein